MPPLPPKALYGTSRAYVEINFHQFLLYYTSPVTFVFDRKTGQVQAATKGEIMSKLGKLLPGLVETTVLLNLVLASDHYLFPMRVRETLVDFFYWGNLMNNLALAYLTEIYLEFGTRSAAIVISLATGLETIEVNDNPLSQSTSVSEFWGQRWNRLVGELLRVSGDIYYSKALQRLAHRFSIALLSKTLNRWEFSSPRSSPWDQRMSQYWQLLWPVVSIMNSFCWYCTGLVRSNRTLLLSSFSFFGMASCSFWRECFHVTKHSSYFRPRFLQGLKTC